jgi:hypothetical protein
MNPANPSVSKEVAGLGRWNAENALAAAQECISRQNRDTDWR